MAKLHVRVLAVFSALVTTACGGSAVAPTETRPTTARAPAGLPIVLSGQSNAVNLQPSLTAAYQPGVISVSEGNQRIKEWMPTGHLWAPLEAAVHRPLTAVVWWQGETDTFDPPGTIDYQTALENLFARIRAANGNPHLLIVVVQILISEEQQNQMVRTAQAKVVARDPDAVLVNVDDLDNDRAMHLAWPDGYPPAAARVLSAITARE